MPQYDLNLVLNPNLDTAQLGHEKDLILQTLERLSAQVKGVDEWGNRRLAYPMQKDPQGYVLFYKLEGPKEFVAPLEKELKIRDNIRRVMITRERAPDLRVVPARPPKPDRERDRDRDR
ncbi:MAG: 30S ribosomal protein S6 [Deinococcus sp.]|nr:30S ribosomal protein S6 [Deinococcus sp.]